MFELVSGTKRTDICIAHIDSPADLRPVFTDFTELVWLWTLVAVRGY